MRRSWAVVPFFLGVALMCGCGVDHLVHGQLVFPLAVGFLCCVTMRLPKPAPFLQDESDWSMIALLRGFAAT